MNRYYAILGLSPGASQSEIKRAYRQKAMQFHPDRNREPDARQKFLEVLEAYEYLVGKRKQKIRAKRSAERDPEDVFEEYMRDLAKKRAREKYRERVREFRRKQAEEQSREFLRAIYVLLFLLVTGSGIYLARSIYTYINIALHPVERMAKVQHIEPRRVHFVFSYGGYTYMVDEYASKSMADMKSKTGMPLFLGDEFVVRFNAANPRHFQIQYQRPNARTLNRYMDLVNFKLMSMYYPKWTALEREERFALAQCISSEVYGQHGIEGLSHIYYSDLFPLENTAHNSISWQFFKWFKFNGIKASCQREYGLKDGL